jgi:hypothetical protein
MIMPQPQINFKAGNTAIIIHPGSMILQMINPRNALFAVVHGIIAPNVTGMENGFVPTRIQLTKLPIIVALQMTEIVPLKVVETRVIKP